VSTNVTFYEDLPFYQSNATREETNGPNWDPLISLPPLDPTLPICSQAGASSLDNTLAGPIPSNSSDPHAPNSSFDSPITSKPKMTVPIPHYPPHLAANSPLLVYSRQPKGYQEPQHSQPSLPKAGPSKDNTIVHSIDNNTTRGESIDSNTARGDDLDWAVLIAL